MDLGNLKRIKGNKTSLMRRGRGMGSGKGGHTIGRGMKGQNSRKGRGIPFGFEGGQEPLYKKIPTIGRFRRPNRKKIASFSLTRLNVFKAGATVTPQSFVERRLLKKIPKHGIKILGNGKLEKKLTLEGFLVSASAKAALEKAGCTIK